MKSASIGLLIYFCTLLSGFGQDTGHLSGVLRDRLTSETLFGVNVIAGSEVTRSNENGVFNLTLISGSYNILFSRYGLQPMEVQDVIISAGDTIVYDTALMPIPVPVPGVIANCMGTLIEVSWGSSCPAISEKSNDGGMVDDFFVYQNAGSQVAVKYETNYTEHIIGGRIFVGDSSFPGPFLGTDFLVRVYDDEGMAGLPGNILDEDTVIVDQYGWVAFDHLDAMAVTDNYYIDMYQLNNPPACAPVGCSQYPANSNSLMKLEEYNWYPFPSGNAMIRPWVTIPHDSLKVISYRVSRFSNFDPEGDPANGTLTELASTGGNYYQDYAFPGLPYGPYAYGIRALYNNGYLSPMKISNIIYHPPSRNVSVSVNQTDSSTIGLTHVKLTGKTLPFQNYSTMLLSPGTALFGAVMTGEYNVEVYKPGYEKFYLDNVSIKSDTTLEATLCETREPADKLKVNPFNGFMEWETKAISQFYWQCDTSSNCHSLTTPELDLTVTGKWILTVSYQYTSGTEAAFVDYSTDHGRTWALLQQFIPQTSWDTIDIDLTAFSGAYGESEIMFSIHDLFGQPYYLNLSEVRIWTPNLIMHPTYFTITLDEEYAGTTVINSFQLSSLENGKSYRAGVAAVYSTGPADTIFTEFTYYLLFPPLDFTVSETDDSLLFSWKPPNGSWDQDKQKGMFPEAMIGYNLSLVSGDQIYNYTLYDCLDTSFSLPKSNCDTVRATITSMYDLVNYGYPGDTFHSEPAGPVEFYSSGSFENGFFEDWASMGFSTNCWKTEGQGLSLRAWEGNPEPAFVFQNTSLPYEASLESYRMKLPHTDDGLQVVEFDLRLETTGQVGNEYMEVQVKSMDSEQWITMQGINNGIGNIDWMHFYLYLDEIIYSDHFFNLRFLFYGQGDDITKWAIDNIKVHNLCPEPGHFRMKQLNDTLVKISWGIPGEIHALRDLSRYYVYRKNYLSEFEFLAETTDSIYIDTIRSSGHYCYQVSAVYNDQGIICESPASDTACLISSLGTMDNSRDGKVVCYPNPADAIIIIKTNQKIKRITLYNSLGMKLKMIEYPGNSYELDLNDFQPGIFLIYIEVEDGIYIEKIIHY